MFLFLSKLLPLFIYPLGFACLMLVLALLSVWKRPRWTAGYISPCWRCCWAAMAG